VPHEELSGRTLGIIGYGRIGQAVAARARAFGMRIAAYDGAEGRGALEELLRVSDFVLIAAPLTEETLGMIGRKELALLPEGAFLINVSRAEIVEEESLFRGLESGRLGGAALDVWYRYPKPGETGYGSRFPFHTLPGVYCTPHYSAWSKGMILRRIEKMCENLLRLSRSEELERVVMTGTWRR
jgi:phosphoglycerate dehydrogenase-like enzyme